MFAEAIDAILSDRCTPAVVRAIESGASPTALWQAIADAGFLELLAPEQAGGAALPLRELFPVLACFGRYAVPVPAAQRIVAAGLVGAGTTLPAGLLTLAPSLRRGADGSIVCRSLPFGKLADWVVGSEDGRLWLLDARTADRQPTGIARSQVATLRWPAGADAMAIAGDGAALEPFAAALHAALLAGAMARTFEMTLAHCNDRQQFGKSLGKFQAVQHQLSVMAEHVAAASIAAEAAFQTDACAPGRLAAAQAKARTSEAAVLVAETAHALHGAIGVTEDFDLQLLTRRLHEWRMSHGSESHWHRVVGDMLLGSGDSLAAFVRRA